ncbi:MAG: hypothetical protein KBT72_08650 [Zhongshania sp.]|nr:hypothetical protein [Zhongshania sp.]
MKYLICIGLALLASISVAETFWCSNWQYASLRFKTDAIVENNEAKGVYTFVMWEAPTEVGMWQNNNPLPASKNIKMSLTEHFGINAVHAPSILNKLGEIGWEAYGFNATQTSEAGNSKEWQLKKCSK